MKAIRILRRIPGLGACLAAQSLLAADDVPMLRYSFDTPQTNVYDVRIETRGEYGTETLAGILSVIMAPTEGGQIRLLVRGTLTPRREPGSPSQPYFPGGPMRFTPPMNFGLGEQFELRANTRGRVLRQTGNYPLAAPLGEVLNTFVEPFPDAAETQWETSDTAWVLDEPLCLGPAAGLLSLPYGIGLAYHSYPGRAGVAALAVRRRVNCKIASATTGTVTIHKQIDLESLMMNGGQPRLSANAEGELAFDRETGVLSRILIEGKSVVSTETLTRRTTVALRCARLEGAELEAALKPPPPPSRKLTPTELEQAMSDLKSDDTGKQQAAATRVSSAEFDLVPPELLRVMAALATHSEVDLRRAAANFLAAHGAEEHVPALLRLLNDGDLAVRQAALPGFGRLKDKRAIEPLVQIVATGGSDASEAANTLSAFGPQAESTVLRMLKEKHAQTRRYSCEILRRIGTRKSIDGLMQLILDSDPTVSQAATEAVRAIQSRK